MPIRTDLPTWRDRVRRFADSGYSTLLMPVFDHLSHAGLHEDPDTFNQATLEFLLRHQL